MCTLQATVLPLTLSRTGAWLPADHRTHKAWLGQQIDDAKNNKKPLIPVIQEFQEFIESDTK